MITDIDAAKALPIFVFGNPRHAGGSAQLSKLAAETGRRRTPSRTTSWPFTCASRSKRGAFSMKRHDDIESGRVAGIDCPTVFRQLLAENAARRTNAV
jgi:hypothetical protein